jgi:hypothetical protein
MGLRRICQERVKILRGARGVPPVGIWRTTKARLRRPCRTATTKASGATGVVEPEPDAAGVVRLVVAALGSAGVEMTTCRLRVARHHDVKARRLRLTPCRQLSTSAWPLPRHGRVRRVSADASVCAVCMAGGGDVDYELLVRCPAIARQQSPVTPDRVNAAVTAQFPCWPGGSRASRGQRPAPGILAAHRARWPTARSSCSRYAVRGRRPQPGR